MNAWQKLQPYVQQEVGDQLAQNLAAIQSAFRIGANEHAKGPKPYDDYRFKVRFEITLRPIRTPREMEEAEVQLAFASVCKHTQRSSADLSGGGMFDERGEPRVDDDDESEE